MLNKLNTDCEADDPFIETQITAVIERDFIRRNVFPALRLEFAHRIIHGATGIHRISLETAENLRDDIQRVRRTELPRGMTVAYSALFRKLTDAIREEKRRGLWEDPGIGEMIGRLSTTPAQFSVGDECLFFHDDDEEYGHKCKIVGGYDVYFVSCDSGRFLRPDGQRGDYRYGYRVTFEGDPARYVVRAGQLTRDDCRPSYICLVTGMESQRATHHG